MSSNGQILFIPLGKYALYKRIQLFDNLTRWLCHLYLLGSIAIESGLAGFAAINAANSFNQFE